MHDGGLLGVEDLHGLVDVGLRVCLDLLLRELRTGGILTGRIADERGTVADNERDRMAQVLELAHLAQGHCMAQMEVGARGVHAQLDVERHAPLELLLKICLRHDLRRSRGDDPHLLFD